MRNRLPAAWAALALGTLPIAAKAQSGDPAITGAIGRAPAGKPVAVLGAGVGAIAGGIADARHPEFRRYVAEQGVPSYAYEGDVAPGTVLPPTGMTYYEVPPAYGATEYRYTRVNDRIVLVDPGPRRIVQVIP